jgi:transposase
VERAEAEAILDGDRETAVALLLGIGELVEANRRLEGRVAELERRLNRSSRNPSLPPSQDPPSAPPRPKQPASGRKRGGQPGHEGSHRPLLAGRAGGRGRRALARALPVVCARLH